MRCKLAPLNCSLKWAVQTTQTLRKVATAPNLRPACCGAFDCPKSSRCALICGPRFRYTALKSKAPRFELTSGIADALAIGPDGTIDAVVDWKSDVDPDAAVVELYRGQVRDYLAATGAPKGFIVFLTSGRVEKIAPYVGAGL